MRNIAVVLAGGIGERFGSSLPKQFAKVAGKTVIEHTIDIFEKHKAIDEIAVVVMPRFTHMIEDFIIKNSWKKVKKILNGGDERYKSSLSAISSYGLSNDINLIFHDAVRPLLNPIIIDDIIEALRTYEAVDVAIDSADTIIKVNDDKSVIDYIPERRLLMRGQTPQAFRITAIRAAYDKALSDNGFKFQEDCGVVRRYLPDIPIKVVYGDESNIKLTSSEDMYFIEKLFQIKSFELKENNNLEQLKGKVLVVIGGSSGIGEEIVKIAKSFGATVSNFSRTINDVDIRYKTRLDEILYQVYQEHGKIDYVINTSAIMKKEVLINMNYDDIKLIIDTNYLGVVNISLSAYEYLKETKGQLLHFTSSSYTKGRAFYSIYSSTKTAIVNFVQAISEEWANDNIKVNCINPERTKTKMRAENFGVESDNTLLNPDDVAMVSLKVLLSDFTGQVIDVKK